MATYEYVVVGLTLGFTFLIVFLYIKDRLFGRKAAGDSDQLKESQKLRREITNTAPYQIGAAPIAWRIGKKWND